MIDAPPASEGGWSPPATFDGYRLLRLIGRGGMGRIYLAEDTLLDRPVAVKFIASVRPDATARQRFHVEARALARLAHPNVVAVHRIGEVDGRPYLVAELVRGKSLADLERPTPWDRALRIARGLARGLGAAHRHGVLHRDIKPENAMLAEDGEVKLIDFGLAKLIEEPQREAGITPEPPPTSRGGVTRKGELTTSDPRALTRAGALLGTPLYMAPELLRGASASRRSDVYALGAVLYELCAGVAHRDRIAPEAPLDVWIDAEPTPLTELLKGIHPGFAAAIARCLELDPDRRFASGESLAAALELVDLDEVTGPIPEGNPYRGLRAFEAEHRGLFFGRDADIRAVLDRLRAEPLVIVVGDSGVGKSSLCRAGVIPRVVDGALADGRAVRVVALVPGARPLQALESAVGALIDAPTSVPPSARPDAPDPEPLGRALRRGIPPTEGALLFIDQLEEMFTLATPDDAARFAEILARLGSVSAGVRVLATLRGDFFTRLAAHPALGEELARVLYVLRPLSREATRAAITGPARRTGVSFESEELVDTLVDTATDAPGGLPLLQFALAELWEARDHVTQRIQVASLRSIGGVAGALARHADAVIASLTPDEQDAARRVLVRLVTAEGTRARRSAAELRIGDGASRVAVEALIRSRLVVARERADGAASSTGDPAEPLAGTSYELAHEALIRDWGALRGWLERDRKQRGERARIEAAAAEWARLGGAREALWSERQLAEVAWLGERELEVAERVFLAASRRRVRWARLSRIAMIAAAPIVVGLAVLGLRVKARYDLDQVIAGYLGAAEKAVQEGRRAKAELKEHRSLTFDSYTAASGRDAAPARAAMDTAERAWTAAVEAGRAADAAFARADQAVVAGLALDADREDLRALLGAVLRERVEIATWLHQRERRDDLTQRLALYDPDKMMSNPLTSPPRLSIETTPAGAEVHLGRYEEVASGARPLRPMGALGGAPLSDVEIAAGPGSYLLTLRAEGREEVRLPILLSGGESLRLQLGLPAAGAVPEGYVYVPPGRFLYGSTDMVGIRRGFLKAQVQRELTTGGYLIGETEVTFGEWIRFLRDLPPDERAKRTPNTRNRQWGVRLEELPDGAWQLTLILNNAPAVAREGELLSIPARTRRVEQDWRRFAVTAIALGDAEAYARWLDDTGRLPRARLCDEREWERAARGADDRLFPHGDWLEPDDANFDETYGRVTGAYGPDEAGVHPASVSPFGAHDMVGSVYELVRSAEARDELVTRGGAWYYDAISAWTTNRTIAERETRDYATGLRMCADFEP